MASVLSVLRNVCAYCGMDLPSVVFGSSSRTAIELQTVIRRASDLIVDYKDWKVLTNISSTFVGDGTTGSFSLPVDFRKFSDRSGVWDSERNWKLTPVSDSDEWLEYLALDVSPIPPVYLFKGISVEFYPVPENGTVLTYSYISNYPVLDSFGNSKPTFSADTDLFRLDSAALELACIYLWKQRKGLSFDAELSDYEAKMLKLESMDKGPQSSTGGANLFDVNASKTWPWQVIDG